MGRHSTVLVSGISISPAESKILTPPESPLSKKRKREANPASEIEVDISAPEPASKKALRKAKKGGKTIARKNKSADAPQNETDVAEEAGQNESGPEKPSNRSDYGIWIGNLSWVTTKKDLRGFFNGNMSDGGVSITRIHLPPPTQSMLRNSRQKIKPNNKGFAYVDVSTKRALEDVLTLSEKLFSGRKVLIKDAKSFEGRPEKPGNDLLETDEMAGKLPSNRIFVGNLGFETSKEEIREHFSQCGEVEDVFLATFEDSGKCKGYGWVTFAELEAARAAARGRVEIYPLSDEADEDKNSENDVEALADMNEARRKVMGKRGKARKRTKPSKWWVNRFQGRPLRMEFAEGKDVRYRKRYGKGGTLAQRGDDKVGDVLAEETVESGKTAEMPLRRMDLGKYNYKGGTVDARTIKPGAALAAAPRLTGAIVESKGKKIAFD